MIMPGEEELILQTNNFLAGIFWRARDLTLVQKLAELRKAPYFEKNSLIYHSCNL
jgi:hypothetical protein